MFKKEFRKTGLTELINIATRNWTLIVALDDR